MQRAARSRRVGLCSDRASALRRGRGSWRSASARHGGRTALALSLDHAECIGGMRAAGSTCPRSGTAAAGAGRAVRLACGGYTVSHPARHGVCGLSQVAGIGLCRAVRRSTRTAGEVALIAFRFVVVMTQYMADFVILIFVGDFVGEYFFRLFSCAWWHYQFWRKI